MHTCKLDLDNTFVEFPDNRLPVAPTLYFVCLQHLRPQARGERLEGLSHTYATDVKVTPHMYEIKLTDAKRGSEFGCVDAKARSRTYRSTALSSTSVETYDKPKSIRTYSQSFIIRYVF